MSGFKKQRVAPLEGEVTPEKIAELISALNGHSDELGKMNGGVTLAANTPGVLRSLSFQMPARPPWRVAPLSSPAPGLTSNIEALMAPGGFVSLRGTVTPKGAGTIAPATSFGTFDLGYRPAEDRFLPAGARDAGGTSWAIHSIAAAGGFTYVASGIAAATVVYVDGLSWHAAQAAPPHQFAGAGWPLRVDHGLSKCAGLLVLGFRGIAAPAQNQGVGAPVVDWCDLGNGTLRINGVWGLQWGQKYQVLLYLSPEEAL